MLVPEFSSLRRSAPIAVYYFLFIGSLGIFWPFFALHLASLGLRPTEITMLYALVPLTGLLGPPLVGLMADALRARIWLLRGFTAATALAFAGIVHARANRPALVAATFAFGLCRSPLSPIADASTVEHAQRTGSSFGRVRLWGSIGYLIAALSGGAILEASGLAGVLGATMIALTAAAVAAWGVPAPAPHTEPQAFHAARELLGKRPVWLFLCVVVLWQMAGAAYDSCFTLHLSRIGCSGRFTGAAWATGVLAEVVLLLVSGRIVAWAGASRVIAFALLTAVLRWFLLAHASGPSTILALQPLHGITFGLFYVAAVVFMREHAPEKAQTAAQGLFASAYGLGGVVGMPLAGRVFESVGATALYTYAAIIAAIAFVGAARLAKERVVAATARPCSR
jgi:PPP family 3-phenylpropionic acid transporter